MVSTLVSVTVGSETAPVEPPVGWETVTFSVSLPPPSLMLSRRVKGELAGMSLMMAPV